MSRSRKKTPIAKGAPKTNVKYWKNLANRKIRRHKGKLPDGHSFLKKIYDSYNIHDYVSSMFPHDIERMRNSWWFTDEQIEESLTEVIRK